MKRVLIVDDEPGLAELLRRQLVAMGLEATVAETAQEAIDLSQTGLLVLDLNLPDREKVEAYYPGVPKLLISGSEAVLSLGGLRKPFAMQTFVSQVKEKLGETP